MHLKRNARNFRLQKKKKLKNAEKIMKTELKEEHTMTTFDRLMQDSKFKDEFEKGYNEFLISEFMIEKMEEENISVRELAKEAKVSPTTIQNLRSGNAESVKYKTLSNIMQKLGYALQPVKMATL
jgi:DNA-binding Xre family transcriptional regulator